MRAPAASKLYVEEHGDGDPLLLVEGLGQSMWAWREQVPVFAERFRTIAYDTGGTGRSRVPAEPYWIPDLAEDAATILDGCAAHVFGLSLGGGEPAAVRGDSRGPARAPNLVRDDRRAHERVLPLLRGRC